MKSRVYLRMFFKALAVVMTGSLLVTGCSSNTDRLRVRILHINDAHSHLEPEHLDLTFNKQETECEVGGMARIATLISELSAESKNHLVLHAGDAVQGTLYYTLFRGEADAAVMNAIGFDAMTIGNHEFDDGDKWLAGFINMLDFPVVSANIKVASGNVLEGLFSPYIIKEVGGKRIGIIGATVARKTRESSRPGNEVSFYDETASVQSAVDELKKQGIGKIIVLCHYGYGDVQKMAAKLTDVDVIVSGDSHTLLGKFGNYGLSGSGDYPAVVKNADGDEVCVVQAWEYGKVLGELDVNFIGDVLESCSGTPHLIIGNTFTRKDKDENSRPVDSGELAAIQAAINADAQLDSVAENEAVANIISGYSSKVNALAKTVIGTAGEDLKHSRVPGHAYNGTTLEMGSDIAPVVAKAFYEQDGKADICIQNGGGVRIGINAGEITYDTAYTLLPFSNTLFEIEMYGLEIRQVLEDAIEYIARGGSSGSFPYCYGLKYDVDATQEYGRRVSNPEVKSRKTGLYSRLDADKMYVVVTSNYMASGRDGYETFATVQASRGQGTDTYLDYAMSFVNYVKNLNTSGELLMKLPSGDYCIKSYIPTEDVNDDL